MAAPAAEVTPRAKIASRVLVLVLAGLFVLGVAGFLAAALSVRPASDAPGTRGTSPSAAPGAGPGLAVVAPTTDASSPDPEPSAPTTDAPSPDPETGGPAVPDATADAEASPTRPGDDGRSASLLKSLTPVVPVARFWTTTTGLSARDVSRALATGAAPGFKRVMVEDGIRQGLADELGITIHPRVGGGDAERIERAVSRGALGFLAAPHVSPRLRALDVDGRSLFGNERVKRVDRWPLQAELDLPADGAPSSDQAWSQGDTWVLVAGGDSFTDRGVHDQVVNKGKGVDFPFDGGSARVTGKRCCDPVYNANVVPTYVLTGDKGAVRRLLADAELAILNHESPITEAWDFHRSGLRFSGRPDLTRMFQRAGIDWVSLANNHIKDYGTDAIADTRRILREHGIRFGGAGRNLDQARKVSFLEVGDMTVAMVPCVGVAPAAWAGPGASGGNPCEDRYVVPDIKKASRKADIVIVFPHWGLEYTRQPTKVQRKHAARWVKAGADLVLGAHSHVAGAIEDIDGAPVLYSMGNFIFDQHWSTPTMESFLVEATFNGAELVQLRLHPFISHAQAQPNLLDPAKGEGRRLLQQVREASDGWLDW